MNKRRLVAGCTVCNIMCSLLLIDDKSMCMHVLYNTSVPHVFQLAGCVSYSRQERTFKSSVISFLSWEWRMGVQSFFGAWACGKNVRSSIRPVILGTRAVNFGSANLVPNLCNWRAARGVSDAHKNSQVFVFTSEFVCIR